MLENVGLKLPRLRADGLLFDDWVDSLKPSGSAENLEGHIGEQTGKDYTAGGRHRSPAPSLELWRSVGKCQFPNAIIGKQGTQDPQHDGTDLVMHIEALCG